MTHLLLVEDDPIIGNTLNIHLKNEGYYVSWAQNLALAKSLLNQHLIQLIVLDLNLPDGNGMDFLEMIRKNNDKTAVIVLTAQSDEDSVVKALLAGANDFVKKPFSNKELMARVQVCLRNPNLQAKENIKLNDLEIKIQERKVFFLKQEIELSPMEFDIFLFFAKNFEKVLSRENIIEYISNNESLSDRTIDSHISHIRQKLKKCECKNILLSSVYGIGYRLEKA